ncbi:hypothetical protein MHUMG1_03619 [Metarhizium humberi]|uniref:Nephrocystin 3-like N-terminal domain-containing protein n=1 Tax=Metarhizium humberi TaxID=2596975 RepID=A0A9P8S8U1_9HYPO|nr:hypothetical protein MHUMG1_03619 [Metarhizium humberi]
MNNNNFGDSAYAHQGPGYQINAAGGTVNNTVYNGIHGTPIQGKDCWKSLAFREMESRYYDIDAAQTGTCEWLSQHKMYREWVERNRGLLWIKGKPGSGKSTLLRHALDDAKKKRNVKENPLILSFFFHGRGTELQRTPPGFYRSLLHQLSKIPDAVSDVVDTFNEKCETFGEVGKTWQWHPKQLRDLFESSILKALKLRSICLFVDALDECGEEDAKMLAQRFKGLLDRLQSTARPFRICFTCRPYPIVALDSVFQICVEKGNGRDISNFVRHQLAEIEPTILPRILNLITERANGVFLWASLVVKEIVSLNLKHTKSEKMEDAILRVPQELDDLYCQLIEEMGSDSVMLIQCICVAMRPLSIADWRWAMVIKTDCPYSSLQECQNSPDYKPDDKSIKKEIQILSHGLIEVTSNETIQFIHQTVKDFFVEKGLWRLKPLGSVPVGISESDFAVGMAHYELSRICVRCLGMVPTYAPLFSVAEWMDDMPLSRYAMTESKSVIDEKDERGRTPLLFAAERGHEATARLLLGYGADMEANDENGQTPLFFAAEIGHEGVVRLLLKHGAACGNIKDCQGKTPLFIAAARWDANPAVIQLLLEHGAACDINVKDHQGMTPLSIAAYKGDKRTLQLLRKYRDGRNA